MILSKEYDQLFMEHFDVSDNDTRSRYVSLDESGKEQMLVSLTSKLYDKIVEKVDDIDFGSIPKSKGDITKIENFDSMIECLDIIRDIVKQYGQDDEPVDTVYTSINNIREREKLFNRAYVMNVELPIVLYNTITLSIVSSISFLIATSIEFIKNPGDDTFQVSLDKVAYTKTAKNMLFEDLRKFNVACVKKDIDHVLDICIKQNAKQLTGATIATGIAVVGVAIPLLRNILPSLQELTYFFYHSRQSVSDYFAVQADLLQMNTANIVYKDIDDDKKKNIIDKQTKIAKKFRSISNFFDIEYKKSEKDAKKMVDSEKKKYKLSDIEDNGISSSSSLF